MPPATHALLSASSSHRWLHCNPSARLEQEFEDRETEAAAEGTAAHALCEHKLKRALKMRSRKPVSRYDSDEMDTCTDGYVSFVLEAIAEAKKSCPDPQVLIEQKLDYSCYVPEGFGTGDCLIVSDNVAIVCNEEGKLEGLEPNRALRDSIGRIYDIIAGTFLVVGLAQEEFASLTDVQLERYKKLYQTPEDYGIIRP
ncbi:MAG: DUF2800 domain-containing protein [Clostridia bacterium]|nr:DUF2800 domain-containing protein [Clostridia bacterium]